MSEWQQCSLGDLIDIKHGFAFKSEFFSEKVTTDVLVTPGNFSIGGGFQVSKPKFYNGPVPKDFILSPGDVIVTMTDLSKKADTLGYSAIVPESEMRFLHNQRVGKVILKNKLAHLPFLAWLMRASEYRNNIVGGATGSTVKHTSPSRILSHRFLLPPENEQKSIANILSVLDHKIECNRRTNEILEAMAQAIFKDWFVDFGPTRRKLTAKEQDVAADPVAIMGGLILDPEKATQTAALFPDNFDDDGLPEGWSNGVLGDMAKAAGVTIDPQSLSAETPYFGLEHLPRKSISLSEWGVADDVISNKLSFEEGQILFGKLRPYFHKVGIAPVSGICSTDIVVLDALEKTDRAMLATCVSTPPFVDFTNQSSTGTKMPRTSWKAMKTYSVALPSNPIRVAFSNIVQPMHDRIIQSISTNKILAETRDYLLPRLMSAQVRAGDVGGVAA